MALTLDSGDVTDKVPPPYSLNMRMPVSPSLRGDDDDDFEEGFADEEVDDDDDDEDED